jgi:type II secretory pathway pseudopilin PulG
MSPVLIALLAVVGLVLVVLLWRWLRVFGAAVNKERAQEMFKLQRERLEVQFMQAAAASGKPRGLRWKDCEWEGPALFVRDRKTGHIAALVGVTIQFEAIEGGDMEDVPAVAYAKNASAVFFFHQGQWTTVGKAVFNMNPDEALRHFSAQYDTI